MNSPVEPDLVDAESTAEDHGHIEVIAGMVAVEHAMTPTLRAQKEACALAFAKGLAETNPRFDACRFYREATGDLPRTGTPQRQENSHDHADFR